MLAFQDLAMSIKSFQIRYDKQLHDCVYCTDVSAILTQKFPEKMSKTQILPIIGDVRRQGQGEQMLSCFWHKSIPRRMNIDDIIGSMSASTAPVNENAWDSLLQGEDAIDLTDVAEDVPVQPALEMITEESEIEEVTVKELAIPDNVMSPATKEKFMVQSPSTFSQSQSSVLSVEPSIRVGEAYQATIGDDSAVDTGLVEDDAPKWSAGLSIDEAEVVEFIRLINAKQMSLLSAGDIIAYWDETELGRKQYFCVCHSPLGAIDAASRSCIAVTSGSEVYLLGVEKCFGCIFSPFIVESAEALQILKQFQYNFDQATDDILKQFNARRIEYYQNPFNFVDIANTFLRAKGDDVWSLGNLLRDHNSMKFMQMIFDCELSRQTIVDFYYIFVCPEGKCSRTTSTEEIGLDPPTAVFMKDVMEFQRPLSEKEVLIFKDQLKAVRNVIIPLLDLSKKLQKSEFLAVAQFVAADVNAVISQRTIDKDKLAEVTMSILQRIQPFIATTTKSKTGSSGEVGGGPKQRGRKPKHSPPNTSTSGSTVVQSEALLEIAIDQDSSFDDSVVSDPSEVSAVDRIVDSQNASASLMVDVSNGSSEAPHQTSNGILEDEELQFDTYDEVNSEHISVDVEQDTNSKMVESVVAVLEHVNEAPILESTVMDIVPDQCPAVDTSEHTESRQPIVSALKKFEIAARKSSACGIGMFNCIQKQEMLQRALSDLSSNPSVCTNFEATRSALKALIQVGRAIQVKTAVRHLKPDSSVEIIPLLQGDLLASINGQSLLGLPLKQAAAMIAEASKSKLTTLEIIRISELMEKDSAIVVNFSTASITVPKIGDHRPVTFADSMTPSSTNALRSTFPTPHPSTSTNASFPSVAKPTISKSSEKNKRKRAVIATGESDDDEVWDVTPSQSPAKNPQLPAKAIVSPNRSLVDLDLDEDIEERADPTLVPLLVEGMTIFAKENAKSKVDYQARIMTINPDRNEIQIKWESTGTKIYIPINRNQVRLLDSSSSRSRRSSYS